MLPSIIISPFMGSYADKKGRKLSLIAPLASALVETTILLAMIYFKLSVYIIILGGIVNGLTGYFATLWMGLMSYLTDTVERDKLSLRMSKALFMQYL
jgi:MFS family permease